jgi:hypothetical protein
MIVFGGIGASFLALAFDNPVDKGAVLSFSFREGFNRPVL